MAFEDDPINPALAADDIEPSRRQVSEQEFRHLEEKIEEQKNPEGREGRFLLYWLTTTTTSTTTSTTTTTLPPATTVVGSTFVDNTTGTVYTASSSNGSIVVSFDDGTSGANTTRRKRQIGATYSEGEAVSTEQIIVSIDID